jgi:hypothetical protein
MKLTSHASDVPNQRKGSEGHLSEEILQFTQRFHSTAHFLRLGNILSLLLMNINFAMPEYLSNSQRTQSWLMETVYFFVMRTSHPTPYKFSCYFCTGDLLCHGVTHMK